MEIEDKAKQWLEAINSSSRMNLEEIYIKAHLTDTEKKAIEFFRDIVEEKIRANASRWLFGSSYFKKNNTVKYVARLLEKCLSGPIKGDLRLFVRTLFSNSMDAGYRLKPNGFSIAPKSNEFEDTLFELELMEFFIDRGYEIDLNQKKLKSKKEAEFWVDSTFDRFYVEAKNLPTNDLYDIIYGCELDPPIGVFHLNEDQKKKIRDRFKAQFKRAKKKFSENEKYGIFIRIGTIFGLVGEKLAIYINTLLNLEHPENLLYIGIFSQNYKWLYHCKNKKLEKL